MSDDSVREVTVEIMPANGPSRVSPWFDADRLVEWMLELSARAPVFSLSWASPDGGLQAQTQGTIDKNAKGDAREEQIRKIVGKFERCARTVASCNPMLPQRFVVGAHEKVGKSEPALEQEMFLLAADREFSDRYNFTDQSSPAGFAGAMQRLSSDLLRAHREDKDRQDEFNKYLVAEMRQSLKDLAAMAREKQEALDGKILREIQAKEAELTLSIKKRLYDAVADYGIPLGGELAKEFVHKKILRGGSSSNGGAAGSSSSSNGTGKSNGASNGAQAKASNGAQTKSAAGFEDAVDMFLELDPDKVAEFYAGLKPEHRRRFLPVLDRVFDTLALDQKERLVKLIELEESRRQLEQLAQTTEGSR